METKQKFDFSKLNKKTVGIILLCVVIVAVTAFAVWGGGEDTVSDTSASDVETNDDVALGTTEETADQGGASKGEDTKKDQTTAGKDEAAGSDEAAKDDAAGQGTAPEDADAAGEDAASGKEETAGKDDAAVGKEETAGKDDAASGKEETAGKDDAASGKEETAGKDDAAAGKEETAGKDDAATGKGENAGKDDAAGKSEPDKEGYVDSVEIKKPNLSNETTALVQGDPALSNMLMPVASGKNVQKTDKAEIDYSNTGDGYVMVRYTAESSKRIKAQVKGPQATYTYNIPVGQTWTTLPLTAGNGSYKITVFQNVTGSKYAAVTSVTASVTLKDQFAPYLRPNQYVNYEVAPKTIAKAKELTKGVGDTMVKVEKVYNYVVDTLSYDYDKAATVKSGYLPSLDSVLSQKKGICFDYASLMTGMLRSQGVPCRLLIGYAGTQYHAWISVWTEEQGWVDGVIRFNGTSWQRMDPTFASTSQRDESIMDFIATDTNYVVSYQY